MHDNVTNIFYFRDYNYITNVGSSSILEVTATESMFYRCAASNKMGTVSDVTPFFVTGDYQNSCKFV